MYSKEILTITSQNNKGTSWSFSYTGAIERKKTLDIEF